MRIDVQSAIQKLSGVRLKHLGGAEETTGSGGDSMELSTRANDLRAAMESLSQAPEVREDRLAELTQQLERGSLTMDGTSLAEKLLRKR
jgi:negative regulator of flagellin synthesis FlgM